MLALASLGKKHAAPGNVLLPALIMHKAILGAAVGPGAAAEERSPLFPLVLSAKPHLP